jgi:HK97 gp10 family phage protein
MILSLSISIKGDIGAIGRSIDKDIEKLEQELAFRIVDESRAMMDSSTPTGRLYRRGSFTRRHRIGGQRASGRGTRIHRASAPGQPPAEDSGKLYRNITVRRMGNGSYRVRFGAEYAGYLEFGTGRMRARPFIIPAIERAVDKTFNK